MKKIILVLPLLFAFACSSHTLIKTNPAGAEVSIDGATVGYTPYLHEDRNLVFSKTRICLRKKGYKTANVSIFKDEQFNPYSCLGIVTFPLWFMGYGETHIYTLEAGDDDGSSPLPGE